MIEKEIEKLNSVLKSSFPDVFETLSGPVSNEDIDFVTRELKSVGLFLPQDVLNLYSWSNGQSVSYPAIFFPYSFRSIRESFEEWESELEVSSEMDFGYADWVGRLFPIFTFEGEWICTLAADKEDRPSLIFSRSVEDTEVRLHSASLGGFLSYLTELYELGAISIEETNFGYRQSTIDEDIERRVQGARVTPHIGGKGVFDVEEEYDFYV